MTRRDACRGMTKPCASQVGNGQNQRISTETKIEMMTIIVIIVPLLVRARVRLSKRPNRMYEQVKRGLEKRMPLT